MTRARVTGSCSCGGVRFEVEPPPLFVSHCHREACRRAHGAGFVTFAGFSGERFHIVAGEDELARFDTDSGARRSFCSTCGSTLPYEGPRWPGQIHVALAHLHESLGRLPESHAFADEAPDWCPILDDLPR